MDKELIKFINELKSSNEYDLLSEDEFIRLFNRYKNNNDKDAFNELVKRNLRMVIKIINKNTKQLESLDVMDMMQEGTIALMRAIELYDISSGNTFSTYAYKCIIRHIQRIIYRYNSSLSLPTSLEIAYNKYLAIIYSLENTSMEVPTDDELCKELNVSLKSLEIIKKYYMNKTVSFNDNFWGDSNDNDDSSLSFEETIGIKDDNYDKKVDSLDNKRMLITLKDTLNPIEYYVLYYRVLFESNLTLEEIGKSFGVTRERIRYIQIMALDKSKNYVTGMRRSYIIDEYKSKGIDIDSFRLEPIKRDNIFKFLYVKDSLEEAERDLLYFIYFGTLKDNDRNASIELGISIEEISDIRNRLEVKLITLLSDREDLEMFTNIILKIYKLNIFDLELLKYIDIRNDSYNSLVTMAKEKEIELKENELNALKEYFEYCDTMKLQFDTIKKGKEFYMSKFPYALRLVKWVKGRK